MFHQYDFKLLREISIIDRNCSYQVPIISSRCQGYIRCNAIYQICFNHIMLFWILQTW